MTNLKICVLGASGFVGANVSEYLNKNDYQVVGIGTSKKPWRMDNLNIDYVSVSRNSLVDELNNLNPKILINLVAHGGYSFQKNSKRIIDANLTLTEEIASWALKNNAIIIHAGSSSEYGRNSSAPLENSEPFPNSLYSITKLASTQLLQHLSTLGLKSVVLRLYSIYGPKEDPSRLMPSVIRGMFSKDWPKFTDPRIGRDFLYVQDLNDVIEIIIQKYKSENNQNFEIYNVGSGKLTRIGDLVNILTTDFGMPFQDKNDYKPRDWDVFDWYANIDKIQDHFNWKPKVDLKNGLNLMKKWYEENENLKFLDLKYSAKGSTV